jgi:kumamolisin
MANAPFAKSHIRKIDTKIKRPRAASQSYAPGQMPATYGMPVGIPVTPQTICIFELGGAPPSAADIAAWAAKANMPAPTVNVYLLPGADNSSGDADGEVALDWQKAAEFYTYITGLPANILLIYGSNSGAAFAACQNYAATLNAVGASSWSWGASEDSWASADMQATDASAAACPFPIFAASGDNDSGDGNSTPTVDCPACLANIVGCGGTSLPLGGTETVWNNGNGEGTGGGFSKIVPQPSYQPSNSQGTGRMVPDLAMNADPNTGHEVIVGGAWQVYGGTSAVAPMMAGFTAAMNGARLKAAATAYGSNILPVMWANPKAYFDVVNGSNGAYNATVGPDPVSGLGRPLATLFAVLSGTTTTQPTPPAPPTPVPPPVPNPPPTPTPPPVPPPPPVPTPPPVDVIAEVDAAFAALEAKFSRIPGAVAELKAINRLVDEELSKLGYDALAKFGSLFRGVFSRTR